MNISGFLMQIYTSVCMKQGDGTLGCMGCPNYGTGGRCGQCEFLMHIYKRTWVIGRIAPPQLKVNWILMVGYGWLYDAGVDLAFQ